MGRGVTVKVFRKREADLKHPLFPASFRGLLWPDTFLLTSETLWRDLGERKL